MALEGRRGGGKPPPRPGPRGGSPGPYADRFAPKPGSREGLPPGPPAEERYPPPAGGRRPPPGAPLEGRERSPLRGDPYEDRYRDPYRDPALPPPRRDDPYYSDPYRRPPPPDDPYFDRYRDDPYRYRREPYGDPYRDRDPYYRDYYDSPAPRKPPPPADVEVIMLNNKMKGYGEFIERKIVAKTMTAQLTVIPEDRTIPQMIEEASKRGHLFAIVINSQNEVHQSLTLNILHGTPQEHRNMPVDDAITLVGRSFETYMQTAREKAAPAAPPPPERGAPPPSARAAPPPFLPPGPDITYLLNLLADNRQLTLEEIDKVIGYLRERRDKMLETEGRRPPEAGYGAGDLRKEDSSLQQQQQELQAKILSILNGPGETGAPQAPKPSPGLGVGNGGPLGGGGQSGMSSLINFDNPHVQKALDNLIQSGPNLLKNISSPPANKPAGMGIMTREGEPIRREGPPGYGGMAGSVPMQHGQVGGQGGPGGMQPSQRLMYGSGPGAAPPRPGAPGQGMRRY